MRSETIDDHKMRIAKVQLHMQHNMDRKLRLDELAQVACLSPHHFLRVFKQVVGETPAEHHRRIRLEWAAYHLRFSRKSITDIALELGYDNLESFIRGFRSRFDLPPSGFRNQAWKEGPGNGGNCLLQEKGDVKLDAEIRAFDPIRVAYVRHVGPYEQCGGAWEKLCAWAESRGLLNEDAIFIGLSHDDPSLTAPRHIRYDACIAVDNSVHGQGDVLVQEINGGDFAVTLHKGPFDQMFAAYAELHGVWLPRTGRGMAMQPSVEVHLNDPETTPPEELLVEIRLPLK